MTSLNRRLLLAAGAVLVVFLGLTGLVLDGAFRASVEAAERDRLQGHIYALLAAAERSGGGLVLPPRLPEARFSTPGSGLYARVVDEQGRAVWRSPSLLGAQVPFVWATEPGTAAFERLEDDPGSYFGLGMTVVWEDEQALGRRYTFQVTEDQRTYWAQVNSYRRSLWGWFAAVGLVLLVVLGALLRWGLKPLRRVERDLDDVRSGRAQRLQDAYPAELRGLTQSINTFIVSERARQERYRNTLADLAHSLKTPLAVLRGASMAGGADHDALAALVQDHTARMDRIVEYQLQRAASHGRPTLGRPVALRPLIERICASLDKVHRTRQVRCEIAVEAAQTLQASEEDLLELLGNLLDNAYKWAATQVRVAVREEDGALVLDVEDDGPGIDAAQRERVLTRGARADEAVHGHGIGLAVVGDIAAAYGASIHIDRSAVLAGARVRVAFPLQ